MRKKHFVLATRKSMLAMCQSNWVKSRLEQAFAVQGVTVELLQVVTKGDKILDVPLAQIGGKGLFVKEIEEAILEGRADLAVHSLKDVPTEIPDGLEVTVFPEREDARDAFLSHRCDSISTLPEGARVGTSSLRRKAQIMAMRPDLEIVNLRGNLDTRLKKLKAGEFDAIILAAAGLRRLGIERHIKQYIPPQFLLPAIGQGCLGIEFRTSDSDTRELLSVLHSRETAVCVRAERAFLAALGGGCQVPIAAHAWPSSTMQNMLIMEGLVADEAGGRLVRLRLSGSKERPEELGKRLGERVLAAGGQEILNDVYGK
ncbi:MAG: hydroxymethylbilane synthase [Dissulfuribacterales bacterium]